MSVKLHRKYNRMVASIFGNKFQKRIKTELRDLQQKIVVHCRKNHRWANRTGALESTIAFDPPVYKKGFWQGVVRAGGWGQAKYSLDYAKRKGTGRHKKNVRYQRKQRFNVKRGMGIFVNYAFWVEQKGFPVLKQGIDKYRRRAATILGRRLRIRRFSLS